MRLQSALLTDWYQLNMMSAYYELGMEEVAVFEFFVRRLPSERNFLVASGLEQVLDYLEALKFTQDEIDWLAATRHFSDEVLERFRTFRFTGEVHAIPEGTVFFAQEPVIRVTAPLPEAQLVESRVINLLHLQTLVASKAVRCRLAAGVLPIVDFGMRRAHGAEAAVYGTRAAYVAGIDGTSNVLAAREFGIPLSGTMAHSFVQAHGTEIDALRAFAQRHPTGVTLLIDTYDITRGAERVVQLAKELRQGPVKIQAVRIDSGDLAEEARRVRSILDHGGCADVKIVASGGIDENVIASLVSAGAPIDAFGVGTAMTTSSDVAALDGVYKLQQYAGVPRRKRSLQKTTWPGRRQVWRLYGDDGRISRDIIGCADEVLEAKQLMGPVMQQGRRCMPSPSLAEIRQHCHSELATLPAGLRSLQRNATPPVEISPGLKQLAEKLDLLEL